MIAKKRMPAPAPRSHMTEAGSDADERGVTPIEPRRGALTRRISLADSDLPPDAVRGKSHRQPHD
jgi:hypothetical protein